MVLDIHELFFRITSFNEAGLLKAWKRRDWPKNACEAERLERKASAQPLTLENLKLAFVALAIGLATAYLCFVIETGLKCLPLRKAIASRLTEDNPSYNERKILR